MKSPQNKKLIILLRTLPLILCIAFILIYLFCGSDISAETILQYAPSNPLLAAMFLILLYGIKSLSIFFPIMILYVAGGFLFSPLFAILINTIGVLVELTIPYWIARASGIHSSERLVKKYPKLAEIITYQHGNTLFLSFFLRIISCLPGDAVSMYLGSIKTPFVKYLVGSVLGIIPGMVTATLIGTSITDPTSPMFWISVILTAVISVTSFLIYFFWRRKKKRQENSSDA